jgi:hypothetical protein
VQRGALAGGCGPTDRRSSRDEDARAAHDPGRPDRTSAVVAARLRGCPDRRRRRGGDRDVRPHQLLARPGLVHLEPGDGRGPRRRARAARGHLGHDVPERLHRRRAGDRGRRRHRGVVRVRDGRGPRTRAAAAHGTRARGRCSRPCTSSRATRSRSARAGHPGAKHGVDPDRVTWAEQRQQEAEDLGTTTQPDVLSWAAVRAASRSAPASGSSGCRPGARQAPRARRPVAQPLQVALPARPRSGTTTCRT